MWSTSESTKQWQYDSDMEMWKRRGANKLGTLTTKATRRHISPQGSCTIPQGNGKPQRTLPSCAKVRWRGSGLDCADLQKIVNQYSISRRYFHSTILVNRKLYWLLTVHLKLQLCQPIITAPHLYSHKYTFIGRNSLDDVLPAVCVGQQVAF